MSETIPDTRIYRVWKNRIKADMIPEGQINQFCQALMPIAEGRARIGGKDTNMTSDEAVRIVNHVKAVFEAGGFELEERHIVKGYEWLQANGLRAGIPLEVIAGFLHFRWIGTKLIGSGYQSKYMPVWQITYWDNLRRRQTYEYSWEPYQARMYA